MLTPIEIRSLTVRLREVIGRKVMADTRVQSAARDLAEGQRALVALQQEIAAIKRELPPRYGWHEQQSRVTLDGHVVDA